MVSLVECVAEEVAGVRGRVWGVRPRLGFVDWCRANITLRRTENADYAGPYSPRLVLPMARLWEVFLDEGCGLAWEELLLAKGSQSAATAHALMAVCRLAETDPRNVVYGIHSKEEAANISARQTAFLEDSTGTRAMMEAVPGDDVGVGRIRLPEMTVWFTGAGSAGNLASKPGVGMVIVDEVDKHKELKGEARTVDLLRQRGKATERRKLAAFSTPTLEEGQIWREVQQGSGHRYHVPCLECGAMQWLKAKQLRFEHLRGDDGELDLDLVREGTTYACEECGHEHEEADKPAMMEAGEWRPTNYRQARTEGGQVVQKPAWKPGRMSAYHSDLYAMWKGSGWGDLAVEKIEARQDTMKLQNFINGRLGEAFKMGAARRVSVGDVMALRGGYTRGTVPEKPVLCVMAADTQDDCWKAAKVAFTARGDAMVSDWGLFLRWEDVLEFARAGVTWQEEGQERRLMAKLCPIDEGGHRTREVRRLCLGLRPLFFPTKGRGGVQVRNTLEWRSYGVDKEGLEEVDVLTYDDDGFRRLLYRSRILDAGREEGAPTLQFPQETDPEFARELASEHLVKKGGRWQWETDGANDFGDAVKLAFVAWAAAGHLLAQAKGGE